MGIFLNVNLASVVSSAKDQIFCLSLACFFFFCDMIQMNGSLTDLLIEKLKVIYVTVGGREDPNAGV